MNISLGNINRPEDVEKILGYRIPEEHYEEFKKLYSEKAEIEGEGFHIFHIPPSIQFKGDVCLDFIKKVFTPENLVEAVGKFPVIRQD